LIATSKTKDCAPNDGRHPLSPYVQEG